MKVFFTASQRGKKEFGPHYLSIQKGIKAAGYTLIEDDIASTAPNKLYDDLEGGGQKASVDFYKNKLEKIEKADMNVFECSTHSLSIGFVIEKSLQANKPTIVLYYKDLIPYFLTGSEDEKLLLKSYDDNNLTSVLNNSLTLARERRDKRFNFFISPKLLEYLEKTSKEQGVTKSKFIRNLILAHMKK